MNNESIFKYTVIFYYNMTKRVTIMIDDDNDKKLRDLQSKRIREEQCSVSYSRVLNDILSRSLKRK